MPTVLWNAEGGSNATGITIGNSGGASGTAFNAVTLGSGATAVYDNAQARGTLAAKLATGGTAADCALEYSTPIGTQSQAWFRGYFYIPSNPATSHRLIDAYDSATTLCFAVYLLTDGRLQTANTVGGTIQTMTGTVPLNTWFRIECMAIGSATVGQVEVMRFDSADSATPTETITSAATQNTRGTFNSYRFGAAGDPLPASRTIWVDDIGVSTTGYLGPAVSVPVVGNWPALMLGLQSPVGPMPTFIPDPFSATDAVTGTDLLLDGGAFPSFSTTVNSGLVFDHVADADNFPTITHVGNAQLGFGLATDADNFPAWLQTGNGALAISLGADADPFPIWTTLGNGSLVMPRADTGRNFPTLVQTGNAALGFGWASQVIGSAPVLTMLGNGSLGISLATDADAYPIFMQAGRGALAISLNTDADPFPVQVQAGDGSLVIPHTASGKSFAIIVGTGNGDLQFFAGTPLLLTGGAFPIQLAAGNGALLYNSTTTAKPQPTLLATGSGALGLSLASSATTYPVLLQAGNGLLRLGFATVSRNQPTLVVAGDGNLQFSGPVTYTITVYTGTGEIAGTIEGLWNGTSVIPIVGLEVT
jgi:hypothetical protein